MGEQVNTQGLTERDQHPRGSGATISQTPPTAASAANHGSTDTARMPPTRANPPAIMQVCRWYRRPPDFGSVLACQGVMIAATVVSSCEIFPLPKS